MRIDHPGWPVRSSAVLLDLQDLAADAWGTARAERDGRPDRPLYVVAEKILSGREPLPVGWPVHGTTGYNYLNDLNGLLRRQPARRARCAAPTRSSPGAREPFEDVLYESKRLIMETAMASELTVLAHMLDRIAERSRKSRDFTLDSLRECITEVVACFPVYRTYVDEDGWTAEDRAVVERAIARARRRNPAMEASMFDFFREVMLPRDVETTRRRTSAAAATAADAGGSARAAAVRDEVAAVHGPVQAKGIEDTAFYRYNVLLSINEVGGDPSRFGRSVGEFHDANQQRRREWPYEMLATATHDTKLGEDVRARINVMSELPGRMDAGSRRSGCALNRAPRTPVDGDPAPDRNDEYRFYQALVGVLAAERSSGVREAPRELVARLQAYMFKAIREAKLHTSWLTPNQPYEKALTPLRRARADGAGGRRFLPRCCRFSAASPPPAW